MAWKLAVAIVSTRWRKSVWKNEMNMEIADLRDGDSSLQWVAQSLPLQFGRDG